MTTWCLAKCNFLVKHEVSASMLTRTGPKLHRDLSYTCNKTYLTFLAYWPAGKKSQDCWSGTKRWTSEWAGKWEKIKYAPNYLNLTLLVSSRVPYLLIYDDNDDQNDTDDVL